MTGRFLSMHGSLWLHGKSSPALWWKGIRAGAGNFQTCYQSARDKNCPEQAKLVRDNSRIDSKTLGWYDNWQTGCEL